jgi:hypothetical protein
VVALVAAVAVVAAAVSDVKDRLPWDFDLVRDKEDRINPPNFAPAFLAFSFLIFAFSSLLSFFASSFPVS